MNLKLKYGKSSMILLRNNILRGGIAWFFKTINLLVFLNGTWRRKKFLHLSHKRAHKRSQERSRNIKINSYEQLTKNLENVYYNMPEPKSWALTSGTTKRPKRIPYDQKRKKIVQKEFLKSMVTLTSHLKGKITFFLLASLKEDHSLTAGLIHNTSDPSLIELLQAPYRYFETKHAQKLLEKYDILFIRFILLLITRPRIIYATNPSTITHFFKELYAHQKSVHQQLNKLFGTEDLKFLMQLADGNAQHRLELCAKHSPPDFYTLAQELITQKLKAFITWDGGYVGVFVEQLKNKFPHVEHIPMFSMSTEALETLPHRINGEISFLPTAPKTHAEFYEANTPQIIKLYQSHELQAGKSYVMVISDQWGLDRYDTQDIFYVKKMIQGLPDLSFQRRREITASVTGEKLTQTQVESLYQNLKQKYPQLQEFSLSMYPRMINENVLYEIMLIGADASFDLEQMSTFADDFLKNINSEYCSKIESGRLLPLKIQMGSEQKLVRLLGKEESWESQFKFLPLYAKVV